MDKSNLVRADALAQLKRAQHMIAEGRKELAAAQEKIKAAQELIDQSADILRETSPAHQSLSHVTAPAGKENEPA